jgi:hypothetical protein
MNSAFIKKILWKKFGLNFLFWLVVRLLTRLLINGTEFKFFKWQQILIDLLYALVMSLVFTFLLNKKK